MLVTSRPEMHRLHFSPALPGSPILKIPAYENERTTFFGSRTALKRSSVRLRLFQTTFLSTDSESNVYCIQHTMRFITCSAVTNVFIVSTVALLFLIPSANSQDTEIQFLPWFLHPEAGLWRDIRPEKWPTLFGFQQGICRNRVGNHNRYLTWRVAGFSNSIARASYSWRVKELDTLVSAVASGLCFVSSFGG
jgi:hypothetical protein